MLDNDIFIFLFGNGSDLFEFHHPADMSSSGHSMAALACSSSLCLCWFVLVMIYLPLSLKMGRT